MLVLSRKTDERIVIGEGRTAITITILRCGGPVVKVGIEAPCDVPVMRAELLVNQDGDEQCYERAATATPAA